MATAHKPPHAPPPSAKFIFVSPDNRYGVATDSIVSPGGILSGGQVNHSVLSPEVRVESFAKVEESTLFNGVRIGQNARIKRAIIEKRVETPEGSVIGYDLEEDAKIHRVAAEGVVVVESMDPARNLTSV